MDNYTEQNSLLSRENIKAYALTMFGIAAIIALYYLLTGPAAAMQPPGGQPPSGPPGQLQPPTGGSGLAALNSWPLWGQLALPSLLGLLFGVVIFGAFALVVMYIYNKKGVRSSVFVIVLLGILLIIATNLIHGWEIGISQTMDAGQIITDAMGIDNIFDFISNYDLSIVRQVF